MNVLCNEIKKSIDDISDEELEKAKVQLKSGMLIGRESMMTRADQQAKHLLLRNVVFSTDEIVAKINHLSRDSLRRTAERIFAGKPTLCALGPLKDMQPYETVCEKLAA